MQLHLPKGDVERRRQAFGHQARARHRREGEVAQVRALECAAGDFREIVDADQRVVAAPEDQKSGMRSAACSGRVSSHESGKARRGARGAGPAAVQGGTRANRRLEGHGIGHSRWPEIHIDAVIVAAGARLGIIDSLRYQSGQLFMAAWVEGRVAGKRHWTQSLFSLQVDAPEVSFNAGQFGRLALPSPPGEKDPMLGRPYSFVNPPHRQPHEFYFIVLPAARSRPDSRR
jgi:hypothetical protein